MSRKFYGIRYYSNRSCTTGHPHPLTGRYSTACSVEVFRSVGDRDEWIAKEKRSSPCGCGGGERVAATKAECRRCCLGDSIVEFEQELENSEEVRYEY